jgi:glucarate dehydratase
MRGPRPAAPLEPALPVIRVAVAAHLAELPEHCLERPEAVAVVFDPAVSGGPEGMRRMVALARAFDLDCVAADGATGEGGALVDRLGAALGFATAAPAKRAAAGRSTERVERIRLTRVKLPLNQVYVSSMYVMDSTFRTVVEIETSGGLRGIGETLGTADVWSLTKGLARDWLGADTLDRAGLRRKFARTVFDNRNGRNGWSAFAGLELAAWDVAGKRLGLPLADLLGRRETGDRAAVVCPVPAVNVDRVIGRDELRGLFSDLRNVAGVADYAVRMREAHGFGSFKYKSAGIGADWDVAAMTALREALGPSARLRFDPNAAYGAAEATSICRRMERLELEFYEDPTVGIEGAARLKRHVATPVATNMWVIQPDHLAPAIRAEAFDVFLADLFMWGGVGAYREAAAVADSFGVDMAVHSLFETGIATAANLHLALGLGLTAHANDSGWHVLGADVLANAPLRIAEGEMALPPGPGLGIEIDEARLAELRVDQYVVE